jgi:2-iminobutanoate/2-iminopropanoate deaminase
MSKEVIKTSNAPAPIGPYNQAIRTGNLLFISGQDVTQETHRVMKNLQAILEAAGLSFTHVVKTTIFLSDMSLFTTVNEAYGSYFTSDYPARETVAVKGLPRGVNVEISMIASGD